MDSERQTRQERIDLQLGRAGWAIGSRRLVEELVVKTGFQTGEPEGKYRSKEFADYALFDRLGRLLAIVEAKRSSRDPLEGERQAADYADALSNQYGSAPFIFLANGDEILFWHRKLYPPRKVSGFFTEDDLERLAHLDKFGKPLTGVMPLTRIIDRAYQIEAVKTVAEQIETANRRFLLVLATGTGKTRVAVALMELLLRQERIQRILFLADRRELVKQAIGAFKEHLPGVPRAWIEGGTIDKDAQIHFATYPGMMSLYQRLSPGYYDLIIADESHRSIYAAESYGGLFDHFDAMLLGLTATPTDFIDHNTFKLFNCPDDNSPTFYYGYDEAVRDKYLVPYRPVHEARTSFQIKGLKPGELPQEVRDQIRQQNIDPDQFSFEGTDLERTVSNTGTNDAIVREFMDNAIKDAVGALPAKTIIFAVSHRHALELYKSFNRLYPDLQRRGLAKVIDSQMERAEKMLDDFKYKDFPRVAISVDMLDTGIDVPAIRNLVFAKPVFSKVKFWQMLGRGTRTWTDPVSMQEKTDFLVIDLWENFDFFHVNKDGRAGAVTEPLPARLFRLRLEKLQILSGRNAAADVEHAIGQLRTLVQALPLENINIAPHAEEIRTLTENDAPWTNMDETALHHLSRTIAPLLRFAVIGSYPELQFENLTEQLALAHLKADVDEMASLRKRITEHLSLLPKNFPEVQPHLGALTAALTDVFWQSMTMNRIMDLQMTFAPLMRFRNRRPQRPFVRLNLPDKIQQRRWIIYTTTGEGTFADTYRARVEALVRDLADNNLVLQRLQQGEELDGTDLEALAELLNGPDLFVTEERLREAYEQPSAGLADFLRHILNVAKLPSREELISQTFDEWVRRHPQLTATQLMFVRTIRKAVLQKAAITSLEALKQPPFSTIGDPEQLFNEPDITELLELIDDLTA